MSGGRHGVGGGLPVVGVGGVGGGGGGCLRRLGRQGAVVCGSAGDSVHAGRAIVCSGARGSEWQCARQCAALSSSAAVCGDASGSVWQ